MKNSLSQNMRGSALRVLVLTLFVVFTLTSCNFAGGSLMPDVVGMSPYEAVQLLEKDLEGPRIVFVTVEGTDATVERADHYSGWEVTSTNPSAGTAIRSDGEGEILMTIKMTEAEAERRDAIISNFINEQQFLFGWAKDSIVSYVESSNGLLILRFDSKRSFYVGDSFPSSSLQSQTDLLAQNLRSSVLLTVYTVDKYLEFMFYGPYRYTTPEQSSRAVEWAAEISEAADAYAAEHLVLFMDDYLLFRFGSYSEDPDAWQSSEYTIVDGTVMITIVMAPGKSFKAPGTESLDEIVDGWRSAAERLTVFTRTDVSFSFYSVDYYYFSGGLEVTATATRSSYLYNPNA